MDMFKHTEMERQLVLQQEKLAQAVISLARGTEIAAILRHVGALSMELTGARYAMISHIDDDGRHYIPLGMDEKQLARLDGHWPEGKGLLGLMWEQHEVVRVGDISEHPCAVGFPPGHAEMHSFLGAPILFEEEIEGVIYLTEKAGGHAFDPIDETIVRTLASACAVAISNARHIAQLQQRNRELEALIAAGR